jgi:hypothetical protein
MQNAACQMLRTYETLFSFSSLFAHSLYPIVSHTHTRSNTLSTGAHGDPYAVYAHANIYTRTHSHA